MAYVLLTLWGAWQHIIWSDEADPWVIGREADWQNFRNYFSYTGHPPLFILLLIPFSRAGLPIETLQALNLCFAYGVAWLLLFRSPFSPWLRLMLLFSCGLGFQYAVIARSYSMMLLILFGLARLYPTRHTHPLRYGALLALAFNTETFAIVPMAVLALYFTWESLWQRPWQRHAAGVAVAGAGALLCLLCLLPADSMDNMQAFYREAKFHAIYLNNIGGGFLPQALWKTMKDWPLVQAAGPWLRNAPGVLVLGLAAACLHTRWLVFFLSWLIWFHIIFTFLYYGQTWHHQLFLYFTVWTLWLQHAGGQPSARAAATRRRLEAALALALIPVLAFSIAAAARSHYTHARTPFSGSRDMANYLREHGMARLELAALGCFHNSALFGYLPGARFWLVHEHIVSSHVVWGRFHDECWYVQNSITPDMLTRIREQGSLLTLATALVSFPAELNVKPLYQSHGTMEHYFLYELSYKQP